jgi:proteic killer suppression protein
MLDMCHVTRCNSAVIKTFKDKNTHQFYATGKSKRLPSDLFQRARRPLEYIDLAACRDDLKVPPSNRLHALTPDRVGQHSISINDQWRICFRFDRGDAYDVEITDYHYMSKPADQLLDPLDLPRLANAGFPHAEFYLVNGQLIRGRSILLDFRLYRSPAIQINRAFLKYNSRMLRVVKGGKHAIFAASLTAWSDAARRKDSDGVELLDKVVTSLSQSNEKGLAV